MSLFRAKESESLEKGLAGAIYKEENRRQIEPLTTWEYKLKLEKTLQKLWTINVAQRWIKQDRDSIEVKKIRLLQRLIKQRENGWGIQYFADWPKPVFIRFIRKNHEYAEYILL